MLVTGFEIGFRFCAPDQTQPEQSEYPFIVLYTNIQMGKELHGESPKQYNLLYKAWQQAQKQIDGERVRGGEFSSRSGR